jgi:hypothetical protein
LGGLFEAFGAHRFDYIWDCLSLRDDAAALFASIVLSTDSDGLKRSAEFFDTPHWPDQQPCLL